MTKTRIAPVVSKYFRILLGSAIFAAAFQYLAYANNINSGGLGGIAMIINYLTGFPVGLGTIILNIPLFAAAWKKFGTGFLVASLVGMLSSSALVDVFAMFELHITGDLFLAAIFGGVFMGFGLGLVYSAEGTTGGVDIAAKFLRQKYPYINFGTLILVLDLIVIAVYAAVYRHYESAMYGVILLYVSAKAIDMVLYGTVNSKACYIITHNGSELEELIPHKLGRGATILRGQGAYTRKDKAVILCVIKRSQIVALRRLVKETDPGAFVIVSDTREVFGEGFADIGNMD